MQNRKANRIYPQKRNPPKPHRVRRGASDPSEYFLRTLDLWSSRYLRCERAAPALPLGLLFQKFRPCHLNNCFLIHHLESLTEVVTYRSQFFSSSKSTLQLLTGDSHEWSRRVGSGSWDN